MKNIKTILKTLPRASREQIYLEAAARVGEMDSPEWEQHLFQHCEVILSQRLQRISGIGEGSAYEILDTLALFLKGAYGN